MDLFGTLREVARDNDIHNDLSGQVTGNSLQVGISHGPLWVFGTSEQSSLDKEQEGLLRSLAVQVRSASDRELRRWGIRDRDALPVRWHTAEANLFDHPAKIHGSAGPVPLDGRFTEILDTYEAVRSQRLVILGEAGAGKTVLAHRLILSLLNKREIGHAGPVPVLFSLGGWNPAETELPRWLAQQLVQDFPYLEARDATTKARQADLLVEGGFVLPVLDGFDEIPEHYHSSAIKKIGTLDRPLIVTSRPDEYATAARGIKAVSGAAAITLEPLTLDEARDYLCHTTSKDRAPDWEEVVEHIRSAPDEPVSRNLTSVLSTPLMVVLARTVYNDKADLTPLDLLDSQRFPTKAAVEDHLLDNYLTAVYARFDTGAGRPSRPNWSPDRARHWLGHLAAHLQNRHTHDLTWWQLPVTLPRRTRILVTATSIGFVAYIVFGLALGVMFGIDNLPRYGIVYGLVCGIVDGFGRGLGLGLGVMLAAGFIAGIVNELGYSRGRTGHEPERLRLNPLKGGGRLRSHSTSRKRLISEFASGFSFGCTFGVAVGIVVWITYGFGPNNPPGVGTALGVGIMMGAVFGLAFGIVNLAVSAFGDTYDNRATAPWNLLALDRRVAIFRATAANAFALIFVLMALGSTDGVPVVAAVLVAGGIVIGVIRVGLSAWGMWVIFGRLWLPLTRRLPWRPKRFLSDANARGVLRSAGAVYQFRHARLRDYLSQYG